MVNDSSSIAVKNESMAVPSHMQPLDENSSLRDVIKAINFDREQKMAIYLAPALQWPDIEDSSKDKVAASDTCWPNLGPALRRHLFGDAAEHMVEGLMS